MNDEQSHDHSKLEIFPDELFFELFEYISIYDLFRGFTGLNKRIDYILKNLSNLSATWTTHADDRIINTFAPCIAQLVVWRGGSLNLHRFSKLRSLKLALPSIEQCDEIQASSTLEHLQIETPVLSSKITGRLSILLLNNAFPRLRTCRIDDLCFDEGKFQVLPNLQSLTTRTPHPAKLFSFCPQLVHLRLNLEENTTEDFIFNPHDNLGYLELRIFSTDVTLSSIENLLFYTPNLVRLVLHGPCNTSTQNQLEICSLASLITRYLAKLRFLRISLPLTDHRMNLKDLENEQEMLRKLHPLFNQISYRSRSHNVPGRLLISSKMADPSSIITVVESQSRF